MIGKLTYLTKSTKKDVDPELGHKASWYQTNHLLSW